MNDDFTAVRGNHTISLGTHDEFFHFQDLFIQNTFGNYVFTSAAFNGIPNFQAGLAQQYTYGLSLTPDPRQQSDFRVAQFGFYAGDQWRARSNLTLTGGVRVDLPRINHTPPANPAILQAFNMATDVVPSPTQFSPRVGFNWDPRGKAKEQLRGGIGIFSGRTPYVWISNQFANDGVSFGSVAIASNNNNKIPYVTDPNAQPTNPTGGTVGVTKTVVNLVDPNFKFPTQLRASLAYDSNLPGGLIGKGEVLFNKTLEDIKYSNLNITPVGIINLDGRNIYSQTVPGVPTTLGQVLLLSNTKQGHGWTFTYDVKRSFRNKFAFDVGYLYGQAFNAVESQSSVALTSWQNVFTPNDPNNTPVTTSDFDPGHRITINASYEQPIGKLALLMSMFYSGQSGHPYTLSWSSDVNSDGSGFNDNLFIPASGNGLTFTEHRRELRHAGELPEDARHLRDRSDRLDVRAQQLPRAVDQQPERALHPPAAVQEGQDGHHARHPECGEPAQPQLGRAAVRELQPDRQCGRLVHERPDHRLQPGHNQPDDSGHVQPVPVRRRPVALADAARRQDFVLAAALFFRGRAFGPSPFFVRRLSPAMRECVIVRVREYVRECANGRMTA